MCASESVIVHSGPRPRSALAVDAYVSVPVRMVLAKTDVNILPAVSCLCVHAARSPYQADIILAACRKERWYSISFTSYHTLAGGARLNFMNIIRQMLTRNQPL